jgi:tetratricopeptide (TPR) repeat protein
MDEGSVDLLNSLLLKPLKNVFIIVATRAELGFTSGMEIINLDVFEKSETFEFISNYPMDKLISDKIKQEIYEKSKGVPYFIHEILISIKDKGDSVELPESIYKSVLSRMDLLDEKSKDVLKCASVLGVDFSTDMLEEVFRDAKSLETILPKLVDGDFLISQPSKRMIFRNMMVREVAYNSISVKKKKEIHSKVASVLESYKDTSVNLEKTAFHYESSENYEKALYFYESSGVSACRLNNYNKALDYFIKARSLFAKVPHSDDVKKSKINIHKKIGRIYFILKKYEDAFTSYEIAYSEAVNSNNELEAADCLLNSGIITLNKYDYVRAVNYFNSGIPVFEKHSDVNSLGSCYLNIGLIDKVTGKADEALSNYKKALDCYKKSDNLKGCADAYNNLGNLSKNTTGYDDALAYYNKALEMYENLKDVSGIAAAHNNIGALKIYKGNYKEALKSYELSLAIESSVGNEKGKAECFSNIGNAYIMLNDYTKADEYFKKAHEIAYVINDSLSTGEIALNRAVLCIYLEDFVQAKELLKSSSGIFISLGYTEGLYSSYYNFAIIYVKEELPDTASDFFAKALDVAKELDNKMYLEACINICSNYLSMGEYQRVSDIVSNTLSEKAYLSFGSLLRELYQLASKANRKLNRYEEAVSYIYKVIVQKESQGDEKGAYYSKMEIAVIKMEAGDCENAGIGLKEALEYFEKTDDFIGKTFCINKLGQLYYKSGDYDNALNCFSRTLTELGKSGFDMPSALIKKRLADAYYKKGDYKNAFSSLNEALHEEEASGSFDLYKTYKMAGVISKKQGDDKKAIEYFEKAYEHEAMKNTEDKESSAYALGVLYASAKKNGLAIKYFEKCASGKNRQTALNSLRKLLYLYKDIGELDKLKGVLRRLLHLEEEQDAKVFVKQALDSF